MNSDNLIKGNRVKKIFDDRNPKLKNYVMFEDFWITENNKVLYNQQNEEFLIIDFIEVEEEIPILPHIPISIPVNKTYRQKFSCLRLNKNVKVGDVLYTHSF